MINPLHGHSSFNLILQGECLWIVGGARVPADNEGTQSNTSFQTFFFFPGLAFEVFRLKLLNPFWSSDKKSVSNQLIQRGSQSFTLHGSVGSHI